MKHANKTLMLTAGAVILMGLADGCVVREAPPPRRVYYESPGPAPVVVQEDQPADVVEVIPAKPGPDYIYVRGFWFRERGHWVWRHGYWNPR
jgi:hypothetical protein